MLKNPWVIIGILTAVLFGGAISFTNYQAEKSNAGVEVINSHVKGNADATVKLVEYSDFQCPACAAFQPVVTELMSKYGDKISFEYKNFPLPMHPYALPAAVAAEAAGQQGKFYEFHDMLFQNQEEWSKSSTPSVFFIKYAGEIGLDVEKFKSQMNSTALRDKVKNDQAEGRKLEISGTPTFFLNGEKMEFDTFQKFIEQIALAVDPNFVSAPTATSTTSSSTPEAQNQTQPAVKFGI